MFGGLALAVGPAFTADGAEGGGVAAAFGGEVAAEADHVDPAPQSGVLVDARPSSQPVWTSRATWAADAEAGERGRGDAAVTEAEVFGALGGVFGDVRAASFRGQLAGRAAVDVGCRSVTEAQHHRVAVGHLDGEPHVRRRLPDGLGELRRRRC